MPSQASITPPAMTNLNQVSVYGSSDSRVIFSATGKVDQHAAVTSASNKPSFQRPEAWCMPMCDPVCEGQAH